MQSPDVVSVSPSAMIDALNGAFGPQVGTRASHAKGVIVRGRFRASGAGGTVTHAELLRRGSEVPLVGRFSVGGGNPRASDKAKSVRGLAVRLGTDATGMDLIMMSAPVFFIDRPEHFVGYFEARRPDPVTGKPDQEKVAAFNAAHPDTRPQMDYLASAPVPASYATVPYWAIHAFRFTNAAGMVAYARWRAEPLAGRLGLSQGQLEGLPDDFLIDELRTRLRRGPVAFDLWLQVAEAGDPLTDPTTLWPESRLQLNVGRVTIEAIDDEASDATLAFNPIALPDGIEPSMDRVLLSRLPAYKVSTARRGGAPLSTP
jgi:catalase